MQFFVNGYLDLDPDIYIWMDQDLDPGGGIYVDPDGSGSTTL